MPEDRYVNDHAALAQDLAAALDIEAGLRDATLPALGHADLVADLGQELDVSTGIAAALPETRSQKQIRPADPSPSATPGQTGKGPGTATSRVLAWLAALDDGQRLSARTQDWLDVLDNYLATASCHVALDRARLHVIIFKRGHDARDHTEALNAALREPLRHTHGLSNDSYQAVTRALDLILIIDRDLDAIRDRTAWRQIAHGYRSQARDRIRQRIERNVEDLARTLADALTSIRRDAQELVRTLQARIGLDFAADLERDLELGVDRQRGARRARSRATSLILDRERHWLATLRHQFGGADLRAVELDGLALDGVRWDETTRWPARWEAAIRADSVRLPDGGWEIHRGGLHDPMLDVRG